MPARSISAGVNTMLSPVSLYICQEDRVLLSMPYIDYVEKTVVLDGKAQKDLAVSMSVLPTEGQEWRNMEKLRQAGRNAVNGQLLIKFPISECYYSIDSKAKISETARALRENFPASHKWDGERWADGEIFLFLLLAYKSGTGSIRQFVSNASTILNRQITIVDGLFPPSTSAIYLSEPENTSMSMDPDLEINLFDYFMGPILDKRGDLLEFQNALHRMRQLHITEDTLSAERFSSIVESVMGYDPAINNLSPIGSVSSKKNLVEFFHNPILGSVTKGIQFMAIMDAVCGYLPDIAVGKKEVIEEHIMLFINSVPDDLLTFPSALYVFGLARMLA